MALEPLAGKRGGTGDRRITRLMLPKRGTRQRPWGRGPPRQRPWGKGPSRQRPWGRGPPRQRPWGRGGRVQLGVVEEAPQG